MAHKLRVNMQPLASSLDLLLQALQKWPFLLHFSQMAYLAGHEVLLW